MLPATPLGPVTVSRPSAVAALAYVIPAGSSPATLTLTLGTGLSSAALGTRSPLGVTPVACPTTSSFGSGDQQPFDQLPTYDCSGRTSRGTLSASGTTVVFSDIAAVASGPTLSFVVLPGTIGPDRLVFERPGPASLGLLSFDSAPTFTPNGQPVPPAAAGAPAAPAGSGFPATPAAVGGTQLGAPFGPGPVPAVPGPVAPSAAPVLPQSAPALAQVAVSDSATRITLLAGLALLVAGSGLLAATDRDGARRSPGPQVWGVGRHRAPRPGRAPAL